MSWVLAIVALFAVLILGNFACAQIPGDGRAVGAAENLGLTNVRIESKGPAWGIFGGCHEDDLTKFTVVGTAADGSQRTVEICAPLIGGYTVRN